MPWTCRICKTHESGFDGCSNPDCPSNKKSMNDQVERLAKELKGYGYTYHEKLAHDVIKLGMIHKSDAAAYVKVCPYCQGSGQYERGTETCHPCQGRGVVNKGD